MSAERYKDYSDEELENMIPVLSNESGDGLGPLLAEIERRKFERRQTTEAAERTQKQERQINELMDFVVSINLFELTVGEQQVSGLGLNEYQERREQFNGILYAAIAEKQKELMTAHNAEMEQKDEHIRKLTTEKAEIMNELAKVIRDRDELQIENDRLEQDNKKLESENDELGQSNLAHLKKITALETSVSSLQTALENERKAKPTAPPSKSLEEQLAEFRNSMQSKWVKVRAKEKMDIGGREWRIVHLDGREETVDGLGQAKFRVATEAEIEEARFLSESAVEDAVTQNSLTVGVETPDNFPDLATENVEAHTISGLDDGNVDGTVEDGAVEEISLETLEKRVKALEIAVYGAENNSKGAA